MEKEFIVYIHGISPNIKGHSHNEEYENLYNGVTKKVRSNSKWKDANLCKTEWGWNYNEQPNPRSHRELSKAQDALAKRVLEKVKASKDFTLNPFRFALSPMRKLMLYGFSDMFYYVSTDGKMAVRTSICVQIAKEIGPLLDDDDSRVSITLIGHSAGSVIAIDLSYYLFSGKLYSFIDEETEPDTANTLKKLKTLAEQKRIRLRRLITFGSPISMLACRKDAVVELLANGEKINPSLHGLVQNDNFGELRGPRWINIWDKDDPIALPIEPLMDNRNNQVEDILVDVSDRISKVHDSYWTSSKVHEIIADRW